MIARLTGRLDEKRPDAAVVDVGGVGYLVRLSTRTLALLPPIGSQVAVRVQTVVREDAFELFGFLVETEEQMFHLLTSVTHVGPRGALNVLSGADPAEIAAMIAAGDVGALTRLPGVGKKTAERLVLELKEKVAAVPRLAPASPRTTAAEGLMADVISALVGMGYKQAHAERAAQRVCERAAPKAAIGELVKQALRIVHG